MLMYWGSLRGFAVVFAEDVPDVSTEVIPPGESKRVFICEIQPKVPFFQIHGGPSAQNTPLMPTPTPT
jgi:hypothetical protein